jgi:hypothetical protein
MLGNADSEERQWLAKRKLVTVFEHDPKIRRIVQEQADKYGAYLAKGNLPDKGTLIYLQTHEGWNLDLCCTPHVAARNFTPHINLFQPSVVRFTMSFTPRGNPWYEHVDIDDREGALLACSKVANRMLPEGYEIKHLDAYATDADRGRFWMFYLLIAKPTKMQEAAYKAWATRRANAK